MPDRSFYDQDVAGEFDFDDDSQDKRCTPELLLEFYQAHTKMHGTPPTLFDCKARFGGIISCMIFGHQLRKAGLI